MIQFEEAMDYLECEIAKVSTDLETLPWEDKNAENWLQCAEIWLDAMREKEERSENKALSLSELKNMIGKPVYCVHKIHHLAPKWGYGKWHILNEVQYDFVGHDDYFFLGEKKYINSYGKLWKLYQYERKDSYNDE